MTHQLLTVLSLLIAALAGSTLLLSSLLRLACRPTAAAEGWKAVFAANAACLALAAATWLLSTHFPVAVVGRTWLAFFLLFGPLVRILRQFRSTHVPTP